MGKVGHLLGYISNPFGSQFFGSDLCREVAYPSQLIGATDQSYYG